MSSFPINNSALPLPPTQASKSRISQPANVQQDGPLEASRDARRIVRLLQCPQCSYPLQEPVTLPCGNSICKKCTPELHLRQNISYPATANRLQGFTCPIPACGLDHAVGDCSVDVVLNKITDMVRREIDVYRNTEEAGEIVLHLQEKDRWSIAGVSSLREKEAPTRVLGGGRLIAIYTLAEMGELAYDSEVVYTPMSQNSARSDALDTAMLEHLKESTRAELDCQVCYGLFLEPFTTTCGHTFCRSCLHRVLDHSNLCPICRRQQAIIPGQATDRGPTNIIISKLLTGLCPEALTIRAENAEIDGRPGTQEMDMPLFICTLSFPAVPTFLHVFEPRYRLMIRRAIENGDRKFGMLLHNPSRQAQGELGNVNFYEYGTLLHVVGMHLMQDGRSLIETVGVSRFRVLKHGTLDGYTIGKIERVDDISIAAEEALEARETTALIPSTTTSSNPTPGRPMMAQLNSMSTQALFESGVSFVNKMRDQSAPWLHARVFQAYGECPTDPAVFPWWFASVLPVADREKYNLLMTDSVRQRLKICAGWIAGTEAQRCRTSNSSCTVL